MVQADVGATRHTFRVIAPTVFDHRRFTAYRGTNSLSISADLQGLKIPQLQGAAASRLAPQRSSFPVLTLRIKSWISMGETMP